MKHIKTLNTKSLQNTVKKADAANVRHPASQPARPLARLEIRAVKTQNKESSEEQSCSLPASSGRRTAACFLCH